MDFWDLYVTIIKYNNLHHQIQDFLKHQMQRRYALKKCIHRAGDERMRPLLSGIMKKDDIVKGDRQWVRLA